MASEDATVPVDGARGDEASSRVAAVRECFEECGVLLARGAEKLAPEKRAEARRALLAQELRFGDFCREAGLQIRAGDLEACGQWVTPEFSSLRFRAWYYLAWLPEGQHASVIPGELSEGSWVRPREALVAWRNGRIFAAPPVLRTLEALATAAAEGLAPSAGLSRLEGSASPERPGPIEMAQGIRLSPLRTQTLPPATHTNCYIVGDDVLAIFDPGSAEPTELAVLDITLDPLLAEGRRVQGIYLTHHHSDHWGGAALLRDRLGVPVFAHPNTASRVPADAPIEDGQTIALGSRRLRAIFTPGHSSGHMAFLDEKSGALIAGDLVAGVGTVIVDPPDGDMSDYLQSLDRLLHLPVTAIFPGHGPPMGGARTRLGDYRRHRLEREARVLAALQRGRLTVEDLLAAAYNDVGPELHPFASRSLLAHLIKLEKENRVRCEAGAVWEVVKP
jgi:glyoxylase-like metal-dependent hydrolase (beta-lactamase superfamily II)/8-oxo-dGTP pyrophosphatase MutT (NUDIX family)